MYTIIRSNIYVFELYGLSTDEKPMGYLSKEQAKLGNGSSFYEMDTKKIFLYDEENKRWIEQ